MDKGVLDWERYLSGDDDGLVSIIEDYSDGLLLYINSILRDIHLSEDAVQETFFKLSIKKSHFYGRSSFKTWLYSIGRNVALDELRKKPRMAAEEGELEQMSDEGDSLEHEYLREERKLRLRHAMNKLKAEHSQALWLLYFEDFSYKEAAQIMNRSVHQFESLVYRARNSLRVELEKEGFTDEEL